MVVPLNKGRIGIRCLLFSGKKCIGKYKKQAFETTNSVLWRRIVLCPFSLECPLSRGFTVVYNLHSSCIVTCQLRIIALEFDI